MKDHIFPGLVKRAKKGDSQALTDLLNKSHSLIKKIAISFSFGFDTEDVVQDVKIKIMENLTRLDDPHAYKAWVKEVARRHCINVLAKRRRLVLEAGEEIDEDSETQGPSILESQSLETTSEEEFKKAEEAIEQRQRVERVIRTLEQQEAQLLKMYYVYGYTLKEMVSLGNLKKSAYYEKIEIAKARWVLEDAKQDWGTSNFGQAINKLTIITSHFRPDESSKEKRYLLGSALSKLGDIYQVLGHPDQSLGFFTRSREIWDRLRDRTMTSYGTHMIALCNNINGQYRKALSLLNEAKEGYVGKDSQTKCLRGDLERDMGSIYLNMGEAKLASIQVQKGLSMLEDVDHRESYFAALRNRAKVEIMLKQFDKAQKSLEESIKHSPPYRALHRLQTKIGFVELFLAAGDIVQANEYIQEAEKAARKYGFLHQLSRLYEVIRQHGLVYPV